MSPLAGDGWPRIPSPLPASARTSEHGPNVVEIHTKYPRVLKQLSALLLWLGGSRIAPKPFPVRLNAVLGYEIVRRAPDLDVTLRIGTQGSDPDRYLR